MAVGQSAKRRGAYPTPAWLVAEVVGHALPPVTAGQRVTVLDPACGDGRFLVAAASALRRLGAVPVLRGIDIDGEVIARARHHLARELDAAADVELALGDALGDDDVLGAEPFDVVVGNPPFLSQLATSTSRGGSSRHGGGPYADVASEFLAVAVRAARPDGGRIGLVLPQSVLSSRDAAPVRVAVDRMAVMTWSWWSPHRVFDDAHVIVCALVFRRRPGDRPASPDRPWAHVVTDAVGVPPLPDVRATGQLGDRVRLTANFRDQYYGLVPAVVDGGLGPPLVTSGLVDPARCRWGERPVTFARRRYLRPTVDLARLSPRLRRWAEELLVPKVLIANQTRVIEAAVDPTGAWVPSVPVITARGADVAVAWEAAAVLTSPFASAWAWHRAAGSGLSANTLRLGPRWLAELPWPAGDPTPAVEALRDGDLASTGRFVTTAYGLDAADPAVADLHEWWLRNLPT